MVDEHSIADSAAPADTATAATLLAQVAADTQWRALHEYLVADGFAPDGAPRAYVAHRQGVLLRSVVAVEYLSVRGESPTVAPRPLPSEAALALGLEANGTTWVQALILDEGLTARVLRATVSGEVMSDDTNALPPPG